MKRWEEAALLSELLDRHVQQLLETTDRTIHWALPAFLRLLSNEPVLASFILDYVGEAETGLRAHRGTKVRLLTALQGLLRKHEAALGALERDVGDKWEGLGFAKLGSRLSDCIDRVKSGTDDDAPSVLELLETLRHWLGFGYDSRDKKWRDSSLEEGEASRERLERRAKKSDLRFEQFSKSHPGMAYLELVEEVEGFRYAASSDPWADVLANRDTDELLKLVHQAESLPEEAPQPDILRLHRSLRTLHLALQTSLAKGRSRWATVRRFAARCESFDRDALLSQVDSAPEKAEAVLTLAFARYLFDMGFNPLIDAAACGLRPDIIDVVNDPAVYVEAKQYKDVGPGIIAALRKNLAQTLSTWDRLAQRWTVPEAFLLVFRLSGRPLAMETPHVRYRGRNLYLHCVDLGAAAESGSRASEPVRIDLRNLIPGETREETPEHPDDV